MISINHLNIQDYYVNTSIPQSTQDNALSMLVQPLAGSFVRREFIRHIVSTANRFFSSWSQDSLAANNTVLRHKHEPIHMLFERTYSEQMNFAAFNFDTLELSIGWFNLSASQPQFAYEVDLKNREAVVYSHHASVLLTQLNSQLGEDLDAKNFGYANITIRPNRNNMRFLAIPIYNPSRKTDGNVHIGWSENDTAPKQYKWNEHGMITECSDASLYDAYLLPVEPNSAYAEPHFDEKLIEKQLTKMLNAVIPILTMTPFASFRDGLNNQLAEMYPEETIRPRTGALIRECLLRGEDYFLLAAWLINQIDSYASKYFTSLHYNKGKDGTRGTTRGHIRNEIVQLDAIAHCAPFYTDAQHSKVTYKRYLNRCTAMRMKMLKDRNKEL
jgi:hypothetical protein